MDNRNLRKVLAGVSVASMIGATLVASGCAHKQSSCTGNKGMSEAGKTGCTGQKGTMKQSSCTGEKKQ